MDSHSDAPRPLGGFPAQPVTDPPSPAPSAPAPTNEKSKLGRYGSIAAAVGLIVVKFGAKLKILLLALPKLKIFTTSASALVSVAAYTLIWTWKFALGFVILLFIHEMGHVIQLRREGIKASAPMFIPFLGAAVAMKEMPKDATAEARVGLAGPVLGSLGCLIPVGIYALTGDPLFQALAYIGFFLNLINLLPVLPLDGGRAMAALSPWMWLVGFAGLIAMLIFYPSPILILIVIFGGYETWRRWKARKSPESQRYHEVTPRARFAVAAVYILLAVSCALGMDATYIERSIPD